jgi:uncharacterized protein (DUF2147 family)
MRLVALTALAAGLAVTCGGALAAESATGTWRMANGKVTVRLAPCGGALCGRVVALKKARDDKGRPRVDKENPNPSLRSRPVIGLTILSNMKARGAGTWSGTIYNPDDGNTYSSYMELTGPSTMKVNGCVAGVLCKTLKFVRVD